MRQCWALVAVLVTFWLQGNISLSTQQANSRKLFVGRISGTVVDPAGQPAAGTEVTLIDVKPDADPEVVAKVAADAQGRFQFELREEELPRGLGGLAVVACDAKGRIGGTTINVTTEPSIVPESRIELLEIQPYRGRLADACGEPIVGADVKPTRWYFGEVGGRGHIRSFPLSADMIRQSRGRSAEDGSFVLQGVPDCGSVTARITAEGFGLPYATFNLAKSVTIELARAGRVSGSLLLEGAHDDLSCIELRVFTVSVAEPNKNDGWHVYFTARTVPDVHGAFQFEGVPANRYRIDAQVGAKVPYTIDALTNIEVKPDEATVVSMPVQRAIAVRGKVVNKNTGQGIPGVCVNFHDVNPGGQLHWSRSATTDDQGAYTAYVRPGKVRSRPVEIPDGFVTPVSAEQPDPLEVTQDTTWPTIELEPTSVVEGTVMDKVGAPVANAEIRVHSLDMADTSFPRGVLATDAAGKFTIKGARAEQKLHVRARTKTAAGDPVNITVGASQSPVQLAVDETTSFAARGTVVDDAGQPLSGANVSLTVHMSFGNWGTSFALASVKTDSDGKFEVAGLWPGDDYDVQVDATGYAEFGSTKVRGTPGGVHDFGPIALIGTTGAVEGHVIDSAGQAVADARVFNCGDGPAPIETRSDAAGNFRLVGFRKGSVFVFAEKEGWRFTGLRTDTGVQNAVLTMLHVGETIPERPVPAALSADEEVKAARILLELLWESSSRASGRQRGILLRLARIDRPLASQRAQEHNIDLDSPSNRDALKQAAQEDLDETLSKIARQGANAYYALKPFADLFAASEPEKAARCVEEAVVCARSLDQPQRAIGLAEMGAVAARLGNEEAGRKLTLEAADMAAQWASAEQLNDAVGTVATGVARFDMARAVTLLEKVDENRRGYYLAQVAASLDDIPQVETLLQNMDSPYAQRARLWLAYRIAPTRPADAVALIERAPVERRFGNDEDMSALAYGWLATAIAPHDSASAHSLIDRAMAIYLRPGEQSTRFWGERAAQPALLAVQAQQVGYPDMESVIWRVLATRPTTQSGQSPVAVQESCVMMALCLALVDRPAARQILAAMEPNSKAIGTGYSGVGHQEWFRAWALADPSHAVELAQRELDTANDEEAKETARMVMIEMIDLWTTPADGRLRNLISRSARSLAPKQEY